jgi:hypothetical protein
LVGEKTEMSFAELAQTVHDLPEFMRQRGMDILTRNAELFVGLAQIYVPVKTGRLRDSIHYEISENTVIVKAGGPTAPYAGYVETKYPFMAPAWAQVEPQLKEQLEALQQDIDQKLINIRGVFYSLI